MKKETAQDLSNKILREYDHWKDIYENGCSDPHWEDGTNLTLTRAHITYYKGKLEEMLGDKYVSYPDAYYYPEPLRVAYTLMTSDRKVLGKMKYRQELLPYAEMLKFDWEEVL